MDAEYSCIPDYTLETLKAYVEEGRPTGDFLRAVLENNLAEAVGRADKNNYPALRAIIKWLFNHAPVSCWGTPSKVQGWLKSHLHAKQEAELDAQDRADAEGKAIASAALDGSFEMAQARHLSQALDLVEGVMRLREVA